MAVDTELYLDNLDEYVNDENRVVTYKWLSKTLSVHVNVAKQMLYAFVQKQRNSKDNDSIHALYLISGLVKESDATVHRVKIVPEENLDAEKAQLSALTSCHLYSVQKTKLQDCDVLYTTDFDILQEKIFSSNKYSAIKCLSAKVRNDTDVIRLQTVSQPTSTAPSFSKTSAPAQKPATTEKKSASIAGMFSAAPKKDKPVSNNTGSEETKASPEKEAALSKNTGNDKKKAGGGNGIASMFAKQGNKPKTESKANSSAANETKKVDKAKSPVVVKKKENQKQTKPAQSRKKKIESDDEEDIKRSKKRRRIKEPVFESSSSEEEMEEELPPTPPREPSPEPAPKPEVVSSEDDDIIPATPEQSGAKRRRRKRKLVSKTHVNDEGFMVTEKKYENYSTDASEHEEPPKPPPAKQPKLVKEEAADDKKPKAKKKPSPAKPKQATLMSFFKKK